MSSHEEYSFSLEEIGSKTIGTETSLKFELRRLVEKNEILNLRKGFYLIIPPRYSSSEKLPIQLYAEKLFKYLNRKYYVGLYAAAKIHGASHQQSQRDYLIIETPKLNTIKKKSFDIQFLTTGTWPSSNIEMKKSDAGEYKISSPTLTFIDLIHHHTKIGGLNRMLASLEELTEEMNEVDLKGLISWYTHKSTLQRTGFLLEELMGENVLADIIYEKLKEQPYFPVLLSPKKTQKPGAVDNKWKIDVNIKLESDL
ncbi:type IV toxin-antitoxin system AbiEi family antitoxin [Roseivirga sp.]|uniref:type IV toxin-antitoxin system AbiEi family antitoxin domain-containing protein n=1 Tax=Roseivirga sp. TaxID=1964215 RepID=UPI002B26613F|nr:type IV toxin-antitoxin system AbiEi family antitoxin [Roseivirga sp.]